MVKLDRALIWSLDEGSGVAVVRAAVELGQALGMDVIAEGIESEDQLATLRELGCQLGQGFLFSKPLRGTMPRSSWTEPRRIASLGR